MGAAKRASWGTRLGFYLAASGSAFGLGSLWRFPYIVSENGGGAFVLLYAALVFALGMPLLVAELLLGKSSRKSLLPAIDMLRGPSALTGFEEPPSSGIHRFLDRITPGVGKLSILMVVILLSYYSVICGWVLYFMMRFLVELFVGGTLNVGTSMELLANKGWLQVLLASVHLLLGTIIVAKDVEEGLEKFMSLVMPIFVVLMVLLVVRSLSLDTQLESLRFLLYPDFSKLTLSSLGYAVGHVFFALSIGFGVMVTFGSYLREKSDVPIMGVRVAFLDSVISLIAGLLIFPIVFSISSQEVMGPDILFNTVPLFFSKIPGGNWLGLAFFLCLYIAVLGATISLIETLVANLRDIYNMPRQRAAWLSSGTVFLVAFFPALSSSVLKSVNFHGLGLLQIIDITVINWILPLIGLVLALNVSFRMSEKVKRAEFFTHKSVAPAKLYGKWLFSLLWVVPGIILVGLLLQIVDVFI